MVQGEKTLGKLLKEKVFYNAISIDEKGLIELSNLFIKREYIYNEMLVKSG